MRRTAAPSILRAVVAADSQMCASSNQHHHNELLDRGAPLIRTVSCQASDLQQSLYQAIDKIMTLEESAQAQLQRYLANHPILLWEKVRELDEECHSNNLPKKKRVILNFDGVLNLCPTNFSSNKCRVDQSGKLLHLFRLVLEDNRRKVVVSHFVKTMDLLQQLFLAARCAVIRIDANTTPNWYREKFAESWQSISLQGPCPTVVLLHAKFEKTSFELICDSPLFFFDEPVDFRDVSIATLLRRWAVSEATLLTLSYEESGQQQLMNFGQLNLQPQQHSSFNMHGEHPFTASVAGIGQDFTVPIQPISNSNPTQPNDSNCMSWLLDANYNGFRF